MVDPFQPQPRPTLSPTSVELLLDLVEIKLGAMDGADRDERTMSQLARCRDELKRIEAAARASVVKLRPGRPPKYGYGAA
jgi:hypothetical protein